MSSPFNPNSIRELRHSLGNVSQNGLARELGCTVESIRNWEHGRSAPSGYFVDNMYQMCQREGVDTPLFFKTPSRQR